jgi:hypothetical protein
MKDKAEGQLADLRKAETGQRNSYNLLKQSLDDQIKATTKELSDEKSAMAEAEEEKAAAEGNLATTIEELKTNTAKEENVQADCQTVADDHETTVAGRKLELKTIDEATKILKETTGSAEESQYSFIQVAAATSSTQRLKLAKAEVVSMVQRLAKEQHSAALAQLASRISAELKYVQHGSADPFTKVKKLIDSMIMKLEKEASDEASEKAYCDEELAKTKAKKEELEDTTTKLAAKIEKAASASAGLKEEVTELMSELSTLTKSQAEMDAIRQNENAAYVKVKADLELGLGGVRKALTVLREFYAAPKAALLQTERMAMST